MEIGINKQLLSFVVVYNIMNVISSLYLEKLSTKCYEGALFKNYAFVICLESFICTVVCALIRTRSQNVKKSKFAFIAILDFFTQQINKIALGFINYKTLMVCNTARYIPVIALNYLIYKKKMQYKNYTPAILTAIGVLSFIVFEADEKANKGEYMAGIVLLIVSAIVNAYSSNAKKDVNRSKNVGILDTMFYFHTYTFYIYFIYLTLSTNEFRQSVLFLKAHTAVEFDIICYLLFHFVSTLMFITILKRCDSTVIGNVGIVKNVVKICMSLLWFKRQLNYMQWISILTIILSYIFDYIKKNENKKNL